MFYFQLRFFVGPLDFFTIFSTTRFVDNIKLESEEKNRFMAGGRSFFYEPSIENSGLDVYAFSADRVI